MMKALNDSDRKAIEEAAYYTFPNSHDYRIGFREGMKQGILHKRSEDNLTVELMKTAYEIQDKRIELMEDQTQRITELEALVIDAHEYLAAIGAEETPAGHLLITKLEKLIKTS